MKERYKVIYGWVSIHVVGSKISWNSPVYFTGIRWYNTSGISVPVAARLSRERSIARVVTSNRARGMGVCLF
jgi:hypothetical protein